MPFVAIAKTPITVAVEVLNSALCSHFTPSWMAVINHYHSKSIITVTVKRANSYCTRHLLGRQVLFWQHICACYYTVFCVSLIFANTAERYYRSVSDGDTEAWGSEAQGLA